MRIKFALACVSVAVFPILSGCRRSTPGRAVARRLLMGTEVTVTAWDPAMSQEGVDGAVEKAFRRMEFLEGVLSRHRKESELSRLNGSAGAGPVKVGGALWRVLVRAREAWKASRGAFDPTVGPLIGLWIRASKENRLPEEGEIRGARERTGFGKVVLGDSARTVALPAGFSLDLGGIAKGYIVDEAARVLRDAGVRNGLVEAGGDLFAFGMRMDGTPWRVGVQDPVVGETPGSKLVMVLGVSGRGVTTSGHYHRFSVIGGKRYSHILDPSTGRPVEKAVLSVTVVALDATRADGLSTAVAVLGLEEGLLLIESLEGAEALILTDSGTGGTTRHASKGFARYVIR